MDEKQENKKECGSEVIAWTCSVSCPELSYQVWWLADEDQEDFDSKAYSFQLGGKNALKSMGENFNDKKPSKTNKQKRQL